MRESPLQKPTPRSNRRAGKASLREMKGGARLFPMFVLTASAVVMLTVLLSQYWGGLAPCELCLAERWSWDVAIVIAFVATMAGSRHALPWVALLLTAVFITGSVLAFYHVGVEQHWFAGPRACTAEATPATLEALKAQLMHQQPVRCDEPAWTLFGVSLAAWNLLASLAMAAISVVVLWGLCRRRRKSTTRRGLV
jgi:disulfide bond formation protein DsbB